MPLNREEINCIPKVNYLTRCKSDWDPKVTDMLINALFLMTEYSKFNWTFLDKLVSFPWEFWKSVMWHSVQSKVLGLESIIYLYDIRFIVVLIWLWCFYLEKSLLVVKQTLLAYIMESANFLCEGIFSVTKTTCTSQMLRIKPWLFYV